MIAISEEQGDLDRSIEKRVMTYFVLTIFNEGLISFSAFKISIWGILS
jgi:hypothetical protein